MTTKIVRLNAGHYAEKFLLYETTMYICRQLKIKLKLVLHCNRMLCCIFAWPFFIEMRLNFLDGYIPQLSCCLPLWKIFLKSVTLFPLARILLITVIVYQRNIARRNRVNILKVIYPHCNLLNYYVHCCPRKVLILGRHLDFSYLDCSIMV